MADYLFDGVGSWTVRVAFHVRIPRPRRRPQTLRSEPRREPAPRLADQCAVTAALIERVLDRFCQTLDVAARARTDFEPGAPIRNIDSFAYWDRRATLIDHLIPSTDMDISF